MVVFMGIFFRSLNCGELSSYGLILDRDRPRSVKLFLRTPDTMINGVDGICGGFVVFCGGGSVGIDIGLAVVVFVVFVVVLIILLTSNKLPIPPIPPIFPLMSP